MKIKTVPLILLFLFTSYCSEKPNKKEVKHIVSVDNVKLENELLQKLINFNKTYNRDSTEIISQWIEEQIYINEAKNRGLLDKEKFSIAKYEEERQLAKAFLFEDILKNIDVDVSNDEIRKYYKENKDEFIIDENAFLLNIASFETLKEALYFRKNAIKRNWYFAENIMKKIDAEENVLFKTSNIPNEKFLLSLQILPENEVSPVLNVDGKFVIFLILKKLNPDDFLPLNYVKDLIGERILLGKKVKRFNEIKREILKNHNIEVFGELNE